MFVSYSRHDEALVRPLASLLGVAADDAVFLDVSSLRPGDRWDEEILSAVKEASVFVLCWCCECESSTFVAKEISAALLAGTKRLVPVLFCSAPLPAGMADRQWIDLRGQIVHSCLTPHTKKPPAPRSAAKAHSPAAEATKLCRLRQPSEAFAPADEPPAPRASAAPQPAPAPTAKLAPQPSSPSATWPRVTALGALLLAGAVGVIGYLGAGYLGAGYLGAGHLGAGHPGPPLSGSASSHPAAPPAYLVLLTAALALLAALASCIFLLQRSLRSSRIRKQHREAESIAAAAAAYFQTLGKT